jgi:SAM-dependent methyltransferase
LRRLVDLQPSRVLDLGCATGLWLEELNDLLPNGCEFIGVDSDAKALEEAAQRGKRWSRPHSFMPVDLNAPELTLPEADLVLFVNVSCYVSDLDRLLELVARASTHVAVRQYDGANLRFGPMDPGDRAIIETSMRDAMDEEGELRHYDLDRLYAAIERSPFPHRHLSFEPYARTNPFPNGFEDYLEGTIWWMHKHLSEPAGGLLRSWWEERKITPACPTYFIEVDLIAMLSR